MEGSSTSCNIIYKFSTIYTNLSFFPLVKELKIAFSQSQTLTISFVVRIWYLWGTWLIHSTNCSPAGFSRSLGFSLINTQLPDSFHLGCKAKYERSSRADPLLFFLSLSPTFGKNTSFPVLEVSTPALFALTLKCLGRVAHIHIFPMLPFHSFLHWLLLHPFPIFPNTQYSTLSLT